MGKLLGSNHLNIEFASRNEQLGIISENFVSSDSDFFEGAELLGSIVEGFVADQVEDYSIYNILRALHSLEESEKLVHDFISQFIFDTLIANQDRHSENWGVIRNIEGIIFSPFYDNGSSLGFSLSEKQVDEYLKDKNKIDKFNRKSKTLIWVDEFKKRTKTEDLLDFFKNNYKEVFEAEIERLQTLNRNALNEVLEEVPESIMSNLRKNFVLVLLLSRKDMLLDWIREGEIK